MVRQILVFLFCWTKGLGLELLVRSLSFMRPFPLPQVINHTLFRRTCLEQSLYDVLPSPLVIIKYNRNFSNKTDVDRRGFVSRRLDNSVTLYLMVIITNCWLLASKPFKFLTQSSGRPSAMCSGEVKSSLKSLLKFSVSYFGVMFFKF